MTDSHPVLHPERAHHGLSLTLAPNAPNLSTRRTTLPLAKYERTMHRGGSDLSHTTSRKGKTRGLSDGTAKLEQVLHVALRKRFHTGETFSVSVCQTSGNALVTECCRRWRGSSEAVREGNTSGKDDDSLCRHGARIFVLNLKWQAVHRKIP
jgi:hypothetical protein